MTRDQLIEQARAQYASDDLEIDDNAQVNPTADGTGHWVQAWVYIEKVEA
jgi:hypothetical protein